MNLSSGLKTSRYCSHGRTEDEDAYELPVGLVRVPRGSLRGRPKADEWPDGETSPSHSRKGEGHRREVGRESMSPDLIRGWAFTKMLITRTTIPSPRFRHKPKTPDVCGEACLAFKYSV